MVDTPVTTIQDSEPRVESSLYQRWAYDRQGKGDWLPRKDWSPLVFYIILILVCWALTAFDGYSTDYEKGSDFLRGILWAIVVIIILVILILYNQTFWAWVIVLIPFVFILFVIIFCAIFATLYSMKLPGVEVEVEYYPQS